MSYMLRGGRSNFTAQVQQVVVREVEIKLDSALWHTSLLFSFVARILYRWN